MRPRVLIIIDTYTVGGAGKVILQFLKNGGTELCEPQVAGFWRGTDGKWQFRDVVESLNVKFNVLRQRFAFDPSVITDALNIVHNNRIDILESHGYKGHIVCYVLKKLTGLPWIAYVHGWTSENIKVEFYHFIEKVVIRFADKIIPVSENLKTRLHLGKKANEKTTVVANAADFADLVPQCSSNNIYDDLSKDDILIGIIGRLSPEKGHRYFIDAFKIVSAKHNNIKAIFVGEGQERESLTRKILEEKLGDKIILAGYQDDVSKFYKICDIVCLPSLSEGMPNAALEAMMFALPVVAFSVGGIPEVVINGETGYLVEPQNSAALASTLDKLLCDQQQRETLGLAGKQRVETKFNPVLRAEKVVNIYKSLMCHS